MPGSGAVLAARDAAAEAPAPAAPEPAAEPEPEPAAAPEPEPAAEPEPEPEPEVAAEPVAEEPSFRSIPLTPITDDEAREPLPVAGPAEEEPDDRPPGVLVDGDEAHAKSRSRSTCWTRGSRSLNWRRRCSNGRGPQTAV